MGYDKAYIARGSPFDHVVCPLTYCGESAADQIVHHCHAFGRHTQRNIRQKDVIVDQRRPVAYFHENILAHHTAFQLFGERRPLVVMEQVLGNPGSLSLPITPDPHGAVMDIIAAENNVDRRMHFDPGDFGAASSIMLLI